MILVVVVRAVQHSNDRAYTEYVEDEDADKTFATEDKGRKVDLGIVHWNWDGK
jgi:hypothetical protein